MALLIQPVTEKLSKTGGNTRLQYGVSAMQGYRDQMEDAYAALEDLDAASSTSFFAVYDGHGGPAIAKYCAKHLHAELRANEYFHTDLAAALENSFLRMDVMLRDRSAGKELSKYDRKGGPWKEFGMKRMLKRLVACEKRPAYEGPLEDGCTACVALIRGNTIIVGNAGDCRCVISRNGQAIELSTDHKPNVPAELQRIQGAGRQVTQVGGVFRIDNDIAVARAIGDLSYKNNAHLTAQNQAVTAFPEVRIEEITADTEFLVIACDGIWDCMTSQQVVEYIRLYIDNAEPAEICASLLDHCLLNPGGIDNMSAILVKFNSHAQSAINPGVQPPPQQLPDPSTGSDAEASSSFAPYCDLSTRVCYLQPPKK